METNLTGAVTPSRHHELDVQRKKLRENCKEFETVMVNYLMKTMRDTVIQAEEPEHGRAAFEDMLAAQLSKEIGKTGSLGIGDILYQRLEPQLKTQSAAQLQAQSAKAGASSPVHIEPAASEPGPTAVSIPMVNEEILKK